MHKQVKKVMAISVVLSLMFLNPEDVCSFSINAGNVKYFGSLPAHEYSGKEFSPNEFVAFIAPRQNKSDSADINVSWKTLTNVNYVEKHHDKYGFISKPDFGKSVKKLEGKTIIIKGFIVPIGNNVYALSKNVYSGCFFCGQAGRESIMGIEFKSDPGRLKTDTYVILKGKFQLNSDDPADWIYHILNAEIIEIK